MFLILLCTLAVLILCTVLTAAGVIPIPKFKRNKAVERIDSMSSTKYVIDGKLLLELSWWPSSKFELYELQNEYLMYFYKHSVDKRFSIVRTFSKKPQPPPWEFCAGKMAAEFVGDDGRINRKGIMKMVVWFMLPEDKEKLKNALIRKGFIDDENVIFKQ